MFLLFFSHRRNLWCQNVESFFQFFKISQFFFSKKLYWDQTDSEINKVMNFGDSSHKTVEMPDCFWLLGPKPAHPSWNRVNHFTRFFWRPAACLHGLMDKSVVSEMRRQEFKSHKNHRLNDF